MMRASVVMAVYNGEDHLRASAESILAQSASDIELIVVDDGSHDATPRILAEIASADSRVRILTQENFGLTRALIRGCGAAQAPVIARQDCGDVSHPERIERCLEVFARDPATVLVSCVTRHEAPGGELLYDAGGDGDAIRQSLLRDDASAIRGIPHHGSAMFLRRAYIEAGGYREEFRFAQDLDLWIRMAPLGTIAVVPDVLYTARFEPRSISGARRKEQVALTKAAVDLRDASSEAERRPILRRAAQIDSKTPGKKDNHAAAFYFIASCLRRNGDPAFERYAREALRHDPLHLRTWLLLLRS